MLDILKNKTYTIWDKIYIFCMLISTISSYTEIYGLYKLKHDKDDTTFSSYYLCGKGLYLFTLVLVAISYYGQARYSNIDSFILPFISLFLVSFPYAIFTLALGSTVAELTI